MVPLLVVPTELTDYTEAYGLIFLESTERIDAARHTTDGTEMIACVAPPLATPCNTPTYNLKYYTSITRTINYTSINEPCIIRPLYEPYYTFITRTKYYTSITRTYISPNLSSLHGSP